MKKKKKYFAHKWKKRNKVYKDDFKRALGCPKLMWLMRHRADTQLREWVSENLEFLDKTEKVEFELDFSGDDVQEKLDVPSENFMRIAGGVWFEELVAEVFAKNNSYFAFPGKNERYTAEKTKQILENKKWAVFRRPFFEAGNSVTEIDFLKRNDDGFDIYEVKGVKNISSRRVNNNFYADLCYQTWVMRQAGWNVKNVYLVYMNGEYMYEDQPNHAELLKTTSEFNRPDLKTKNFESDLQRIRQLLTKDFTEIQPWLLDSRCEEKKTSYCTHLAPKVQSQHSWVHLYRLNRKKKAQMAFDMTKNPEWLDLQKINLQDYAHVNFSKRHHRQVNVIQKLENELKDVAKAKAILARYKFPIYFFDFETSQIQIPKFPYTKPYVQIPFQYSVFVLKNEDYDLKTRKNMASFQFVIENRNDPRTEFIKHFLRDVQSSGHGTYVAYNTAFEKMVLKSIPQRFMNEQQILLRNKIVDQALDLMDFFKDFNIYLPTFFGSLSLKKTLPVFAPDFSYSNLAIQKGDQASNLYFCYIYEKINDAQWQRQIENLKRYCDLDTLGMVVLYDEIKKMIAKNS